MLHITDTELEILHNILKKYSVKFYAFGSRIKGTHQQFSDLDLCYKEPLSQENINQLREALENSNLAFTVDLVNYNLCPHGLRDLIDKEAEPIGYNASNEQQG